MKRLSVLFFMALCLFVSKSVQSMEEDSNIKKLIIAASEGDEAKVKEYLPLVDDPNIYLNPKKHKLGYAELNALTAASYNGRNNIIDLLLDPESQEITPKKSIDVNAEAGDGYGPLFAAIEGEKYESAKKLVDAGININTVLWPEDNTPLHKAVDKKLDNIVKLLIVKGADLDTKNRSDQTPLELAQNKGYSEIIRMLEEPERLEQEEERERLEQEEERERLEREEERERLEQEEERERLEREEERERLEREEEREPEAKLKNTLRVLTEKLKNLAKTFPNTPVKLPKIESPLKTPRRPPGPKRRPPSRFRG